MEGKASRCPGKVAHSCVFLSHTETAPLFCHTEGDCERQRHKRGVFDKWKNSYQENLLPEAPNPPTS